LSARDVADDLVDDVGAQLHNDVALADVVGDLGVEQPEVRRCLLALVRVDQEDAMAGTAPLCGITSLRLL
jgi:hypothetical protein